MNYLAELLDKKQKQHEIAGFDCGIAALNIWLTTQAGQAARKGHSVTFVIANDQNVVLGYYALAVRKSFPTESLPPQLAAVFPAGANAAVLARLAVDLAQQGKGVGAVLLREAMQRVKEMAAETGDVLLYVDAKDGQASFYVKYGFTPLASDPQTLFIRIDEIP
jgi:GNAT superfamily N-acetyltransferase